jgi:CHU_C Type IX secretion signal domain/PKD-like domain/SprB repeat
MTKRLLFCFIALLATATSIYAQLPPACPSDNTPPSDLCPATCIYCDFNGISSTSTGYTAQTPPGWCGSIENEQWLGFIANCNTVTFIATATNCTNGNGLQIGVYTSCSGSPVSCNGGTSGGALIPVPTTAQTIPGQNYFLCVDGWAGDQCDFTITVVPPQCAGAPPLFATLPIQGPQSVCPTTTHVFTVPAVSGAASYVWNGPAGSTINGQAPPVTLTSGLMTKVTITFPAEPTAGVHEICVQPFNSCNDGIESCKSVLIKSIPPTLFPQVSVCPEDLPYSLPWGEVINETGFYEVTLPTLSGCDSILRQFVFVKPEIPRVLPPAFVCAGQTITVCGMNYGAGDYSVVCPASNLVDCDTTFIFTVIELPVSAVITETGPLNCAVKADTLYAGPSSGTLAWYFGGSQIGTGNSIIATVAGSYTLIAKTAACSDTAVFVVTGNPLEPDVKVDVPNQLNCASSTVILNATSTLPGVVFNWGGGNTTPVNTVSTAGSYTVTVTLPGTTCEAVATATVTGNTTPPTGSATATLITCANATSTMTATSSAATATYSWSNGLTGASVPTSTAGTYTITITNTNNGCTGTTSVTATSNTTPPVAIATGNTINCKDATVAINASSTTPGVTYAWSNGAFGGSTIVSAAGPYSVVVTNPANGCTSSASATVLSDLAAPTSAATGGLLTCAITQTNLNGTSTTPGVTYDWMGPGNFTSTQQNPVVNTAGTFTLVVTNSVNGCTSSSTANVPFDNAPPVLTATGGIISCNAASIVLNASSTTPGVTYEWIGAGNISLGVGATYTATAPGTYNVVATNPSNGCSKTVPVVADADKDVPQLTLNGSEITCKNATTQLVATSTTPGATGMWSTGSTAFTLNVTTPGSYTFTVTNPANGCDVSKTVPVNDKTTSPTATATGGTLTCLAGNLQISGSSNTPGVTYAWSLPPGSFTSTQQNPIITDAGTYNLVVTNPANGCTASTTASVNQDTNAPTASATTGTLSCAVTSISLNSTGTGPSPVTKYEWQGPGGVTSSSQNLTAIAAGNYTVTVTSLNGCTDAATVVVAQDIAPPTAITANTSGVIGCTVTSVDLTAATTSTGPVTYAWSSGLGSTSMINTANPGTYTVTVTSGGNGCSATASVQVQSIVANPVVTASVPGELNCSFVNRVLNGGATLSNPALNIVSYAWSGPNGFSSTIEDPTVTAPGTYTLLVTANNGCTSTASVPVSQNIALPSVTATGGVLTCTAASITINASSSTPGVAYSWSGSCITPATMPLQNPSVCSADTYVVVATAPNGCTSSASAIVTPDANAPVVAIAAPITELTCSVLNASFTASTPAAGVNYKWSVQGSPTILAATPALTVTTPNTYVVTVTAPNGCTTLQDILITQDIAKPTATTVNDSLDCITGQGTLVVNDNSATATYSWTGPGNTIGTTKSLVVTNPGTYTVVVTDGDNGCTAAFTAKAIPNTTSPNVGITGSGVLTCSKLSVALTGTSTTAGVTSAWSGPAGPIGATALVNVTVPGVYQYTATAPNGCKSSESLTIIQDIAPPASLVATANTLTCAAPSQSLNITTSTTGSTYNWSGPSNFTSPLQSPSATVQGNYTVTVTGPNGCSATATTTMLSNQNNPDLTASANFATLTCTNPAAKLDANSSVAGIIWAWSGPGLVSTIEDPTTNQSGTFTVVANAPNGCSSTASVTIGINQTPPNATASGGIVTCAAPAINLAGSSTTTGATYQWLLNGTPIATTPNPSVTQLGNYTLVVTGPNGCTFTAQAAVASDGSIPNVSANAPTLTCSATSVTITGTSNQQVTWVWTGPGGFTSTLPAPVVAVPGPYNVVITNPVNGCTASTSWNVQQNILAPNLSISNPPLLDCNSTEVAMVGSVTGTSTYSFAWSTNSGSIVSGANNATALASQPGQYTLLVTDTQNGCTTTDATNVASDPNIPTAAAAQIAAVKCFGDTNGSIALGSVSGGAAPYVYSIDSQPFTTSSTFTFLAPGQHDIVIQDANGCEVTVAYTVGEPQQLAINIGLDTTIRLGEYLDINLDNLEQYVNDPTRAKTFTYTPANFDKIFCDTCLVRFSTRYTVTVQDTNGCKATDDRLVKVDRTRSVVIPNVFNPNSATGNNIFTLYGGIDVARIKSFGVYDRWGERVWESSDFTIADNFQNGWSGKFLNKEAPVAVYVYVIDVLFKDGESEIYKGDVTLMK